MESVIQALVENAFIEGEINFTSCPKGYDPVRLSQHLDHLIQCRKVHEVFKEKQDQDSADDTLPDLVDGVGKLVVSAEEEPKLDAVHDNQIDSKSM